MSIASDMLTAISGAFPSASATATTAAGLVVSVVCPSVSLQRQNSELGTSDMPTCFVYVDAVNVPETGMKQSDVLTITRANGKVNRFRIGAVDETESLTTLTMVAENG